MTTVQLHNFSEKIKLGLNKLNQWPSIQNIAQVLAQKHRICWLSGGVVRDLILSRLPADIDLTTDATEEEILELFPQTLLVGREFGVYKISIHGETFDLTVFREEGEYVDGRRPQEIRRSTPKKDAERRDFTVNALFWDLTKSQLVDYVNGISDIEKKLIRCVGNPLVRFQEDFLRVLRMLRLAYQLDFKMDEESYRAAATQAASLIHISGERICSELYKLKQDTARWHFLHDPLTQEVFKHNGLSFENAMDKIENLKLTRAHLKDFEILIMSEILYLLGINMVNVNHLQRRLKLSNGVKAWLVKCCEIQNYAQQNLAISEFCLLADRSEDYFEILKYFSELKLISKELAQHIINVYCQHSTALISAQDILQIVPIHKISKTLSHVRKLQFEGRFANAAAALDYVKRLDVRQE